MLSVLLYIPVAVCAVHLTSRNTSLYRARSSCIIYLSQKERAFLAVGRRQLDDSIFSVTPYMKHAPDSNEEYTQLDESTAVVYGWLLTGKILKKNSSEEHRHNLQVRRDALQVHYRIICCPARRFVNKQYVPFFCFHFGVMSTAGHTHVHQQ